MRDSPTTDKTDIKGMAKWIEHNTIERCAQVAAKVLGTEEDEVVAAIRALKDKP